MADKNLHDIKIDELDSPKKTPLKNILTLLALLFIILVISVVITKLILNTDEDQEVENATDIPTLSADVKDSTNSTTNTDDKNNSTVATTTAAAAAVAAVAAPTVANVLERNLTSRTKVPLRTHNPVKEVKKDTISSKTPTATPKKYKIPKHTYVAHTKAPKKHTSTVHTTKTPKKHTSTVHTTKAPKKAYIDKVVTKKSTTAKKSTTSSKKASYLGGQLKKLTDSYYIKVGSYRDTSTVVRKIKKSNFNYSITKLKDDKTISRVLVGPFFSENEAQKNIAKVKSTILPGAYITKVKP